MQFYLTFEFLQAIRSDEFFRVCEDHIAIAALETRNLQAEFLAHPHVIRIEKSQQRTICQFDPAVARRGRARPVLPNIAQATVVEGPRHLKGRVGRPIIDDDDFEIAEGLGSDLRKQSASMLAH